jgi:hypothetical protein
VSASRNQVFPPPKAILYTEQAGQPRALGLQKAKNLVSGSKSRCSTTQNLKNTTRSIGAKNRVAITSAHLILCQTKARMMAEDASSISASSTQARDLYGRLLCYVNDKSQSWVLRMDNLGLISIILSANPAQDSDKSHFTIWI